MKKNYALVTFILILSIFLNSIQAQSSQHKINQVELMKRDVGMWQANIGKDSLEIWECQQYGKAFVINVYQVINGQKIPLFINNIEFSSTDGKFKGFMLRYDGSYATWIGIYNTENRFSGNFVQNFDPEMINGRFVSMYETPASFTMTQFDKGGEKVYENKFSKVK